jgi:dephospho-CoA kinase
MKRIGLTGNIGTGKSTIARFFEILKIPVYHADIMARRILDSDPVKEKISSIFGTNLLNPQNQVDRKALASLVFDDKQKLETLNKLIHPLVKEDFEKWCLNQGDHAYIIHEAAILFESGFDKLFGANILVIAPENICISRVMSRDGVSKEMVLSRMKNQWKQDQKKPLADYILVNDGKSMIIPQVLDIHKQILDLSKRII